MKQNLQLLVSIWKTVPTCYYRNVGEVYVCIYGTYVFCHTFCRICVWNQSNRDSKVLKKEKHNSETENYELDVYCGLPSAGMFSVESC